MINCDIEAPNILMKLNPHLIKLGFYLGQPVQNTCKMNQFSVNLFVQSGVQMNE